MRVLVTGGTGFIGRNLVEALLERGDDVTTLSSRPTGLPGVPHLSVDATSPEIAQIAAGFEAVAHLAAISNASLSIKDPVGYNRINTLGTLSVLEGAREGGAKVVFSSTQRIFRPSREPLSEDSLVEPQDPYAYSKLCGEKWLEMYVRFYGVNAVTVRFFSVYGPGLVVTSGASGVVGLFVSKASRGERIVVHRNQLRDLTYVSDVVQGILLAMDKPVAPGSSYNIATGTGTTMEDLALEVCRATGSTSEVIVEESAAFGYSVADTSRARAELDFAPRVYLKEGLDRYIAWFRDNC